MKILIVTYYHPLLDGGGGDRPARMAKYLPRLGHEVRMLAATYQKRPRQDGDVFPVYDPSHTRDRRGRNFWRWLFLRAAVEILNRIGICVSVFSFWKRAAIRRGEALVAAWRPDLIIATYPPVETLEIALRLQERSGIPFLADFRDGLLFEPIESKRLRRFACVRRAYAGIERRVVAKAAALVTVSEPLSRYFRVNYGHPRVETIANGFDPNEVATDLPTIELEPECFHIVHTGRFALSDAGCDIAPLAAALEGLLAARPQFERTLRLHLLGDLARREKKLLAALEKRGVALVHGAVPRLRALAFQRRADLLLLVTSPARGSVATTKLFEYLQARRPVLALTGRTFAAEIVAGTRCGWVVSPRSAPEIQAALERLIEDPSRLREADLAPEAIRNYSFPSSLERLDAVLRSIREGAAVTPAP
ncbi:MAG: glycosyltransferase [Acidobacteria bacterium]|jgi:glycosyltransferase involved in cell wall biosynthesis|nr:glycosyltransferase [Acidobacteriota bacterium]